MSELSEYLGITDEQLDELDIELNADTVSSGEMTYSYWFHVPADITDEVMQVTGWKGGELVSGIPVHVVEAEQYSRESELDHLLNEIFLPEESPYKDLQRKIKEYRNLVVEHQDKTTGATLQAVLFAATIGALEAYLWEIVHWKIDNDANAANQIIKNCQGYGDISFKLSEIVSEGFSPKKQLKNALDQLIWHRIEKVAPIFIKGLDINFPSVKFIKDATVLRHHIVHRSGKNTDGDVVLVSFDQVTKLFDDVLTFASSIDRQLYKIHVVNVATNQSI
jgi:hypothetical protein